MTGHAHVVWPGSLGFACASLGGQGHRIKTLHTGLEAVQAEICVTQWEDTLKSPDQNKQIHVVQTCQMEHFRMTL